MPVVDGHIRCHRCSELKPLSEYQPSVVRAGCGACRACKYSDKRAYEVRNREKANAARNALRTRDPERHRAKMREHYRSNPEMYRNYNLGRYGISTEQYEAVLAAQGGRCACCGSVANASGKRLFVDHDHVTGAVRGVLCHKCNAGIGSLGDNIEGVRRALAYLERSQQAPPLRVAPTMRINLLQGAN
jgi:hypothetical protein